MNDLVEGDKCCDRPRTKEDHLMLPHSPTMGNLFRFIYIFVMDIFGFTTFIKKQYHSSDRYHGQGYNILNINIFKQYFLTLTKIDNSKIFVN